MKVESRSGPMIIDEALVQSMDQLYSRVELFPFEARAIVETAVDDISLLKPKDEDWNHQLDKFLDGTLEVNLLDIQVFARQLLEFGRESGIFLDGADVNISPLSATLAAQRVVRIVQETWNRSREMIMQHSVFLNVESKQQAKRPSEYSQEDVRAIIGSLGLIFDNFSHCKSGHALICVPRGEVRKTFGLSSSLLLLRFLTVQRVLQLLELWSDRGASHGLPNMPFSREVQAWGLLLPALEQQVECAVFPKLLSCYRTVSRTADYGWSLSLLTMLCSRIAGKSGTLVPTGALGQGQGPGEEDSSAYNERLCGWVEVQSEVMELDVQLMDTLYQEGLLLIEEGGGREGKVLALVPLLGMRCLRSDFGSNSHMLDAQTAARATSYSSQNEVDSDSGRVVCRVDAMESLMAACDRFDWYDRPVPDMLHCMAGGIVEIIASQDVYSHHRVGVKLLSSFSSSSAKGKSKRKKGGGQGYSADVEIVIDALPIECLTLLPATTSSPLSRQESDSRSYSASDAETRDNWGEEDEEMMVMMAEPLEAKRKKGAPRRSTSQQQGPQGETKMNRDRTGSKTGAPAKGKGKGKRKPSYIDRDKGGKDTMSNNSTIASESGLFQSTGSSRAAGQEKADYASNLGGNKRGIAGNNDTNNYHHGDNGLDLHSGRGVEKKKKLGVAAAKAKGGGGGTMLPPRSALRALSPSPPSPAPAPASAAVIAATEGPVVIPIDKPCLRLAVSAGDDNNNNSNGAPESDADADAGKTEEGLLTALNTRTIHVSRPRVITRPSPLYRDRGKEGKEKGKDKQRVKVPPVSSWMRASAVTASRDFDLQVALRRLEDGLNHPHREPAHLHPAYQAMVRLEQSVRHYHGVVTKEDMEETVKNFAVLKLLGKSVHPSVAGDMAARHSRGIRYTDYAQYLQEQEQEEREELRKIEEEEYVQAGRAIAVTQVEYIPFDPAREAGKLASMDNNPHLHKTEGSFIGGDGANTGEGEPYLQVLKARKVARAVTRTLVPVTISSAGAGAQPRVVLMRGGAFKANRVHFADRPSASAGASAGASDGPIAVVTKTRRVVHAIPSEGEVGSLGATATAGVGVGVVVTERDATADQADIDEVETERLATRLQLGSPTTLQDGSTTGAGAWGEGDLATSLSPRSRPVRTLLEVSKKPILQLQRSGDSGGGGGNDNDNAMAGAGGSPPPASPAERVAPYWRPGAIRAAASDAGVGTRAFSERITAHATSPGFNRPCPSPERGRESPGGVAPTPNILRESIAVEEALRRRRENAGGSGGRITRVGALFAGMNEEEGAIMRFGAAEEGEYRDGEGARPEGGGRLDFVDFVQGSRLAIQRPKNRFYRVPPRLGTTSGAGAGGGDAAASDEDTVDTRAYSYALAYSSEAAFMEAVAPRPPYAEVNLGTRESTKESDIGKMLSAKTDLLDSIGHASSSSASAMTGVGVGGGEGGVLSVGGKHGNSNNNNNNNKKHLPAPASFIDNHRQQCNDNDGRRPVTAPPAMDDEAPKVSPRVDHMEGLAFLRPSLDDADGIDYYGAVGQGEERLEKLLYIHGRKQRQAAPWTQEKAAPDPNKIDREAKRTEEKQAREHRLQKSKAKFKIRPDSPPPPARPMSGLPSSPPTEVRAALRDNATSLDMDGGVVTDPVRLQAMTDALQSHLIEPSLPLPLPLSLPSANAERLPLQTNRDRDGEKGALQASVPTLPTLPVAISADDDGAITDRTSHAPDASATTGNTLVKLVETVVRTSKEKPGTGTGTGGLGSRSPSPSLVVVPRPGSPSTIAGCAALGKGYPDGPYRLDPREREGGDLQPQVPPSNTPPVEITAPPAAAAAAAAAGTSSLLPSSRLAQIGPAEVEVSVSVKTAPPLYLSRQRGQIEHEKAVVKDSGFDLGALIDDLLSRRELAQTKQEQLATPSGGSLPIVHADKGTGKAH